MLDTAMDVLSSPVHECLTESLKEKILFLTSGSIDISSNVMATDVTEPMMIDSSNVEEQKPYPNFESGPFEGVEKRLIVEFNIDSLLSSPFLTGGSLRSLTSAQWQSVLDKAVCQILSSRELETDSGACTAYLLSESSLFVYDHRVILKTCGTTTPLLALPSLISFVTGVNQDSTPVIQQSCFDSVVTPCKHPSGFGALSLSSLTTMDSVCSMAQLQSLSCGMLSSEKDSPLAAKFVTPLQSENLTLPNNGLSSPPSVTTSSDSQDRLCSVSLNGLTSDDELSSGSMKAVNSDLQYIPTDDRIPPQSAISWILFSHLTYCFPQKQRFPHRSNNEESLYIDEVLINHGIPVQSRDIFSLQTSPDRQFFVYAYRNPWIVSINKNPSITISELMMLQINEWCVDDFAGKGNGYNADPGTAANSIIQQIMKPTDGSGPNKSVLDQFWFSPCGYSCNALMDTELMNNGMMNSGPHFATAHISPEPASSYASLEATFPFNLMSEESMNTGSYLLCPVTALTTFNPINVHVVEVQLYFDERHNSKMLGGVSGLKSRCSDYEFVSMDEYEGSWIHVRHSEYKRL